MHFPSCNNVAIATVPALSRKEAFEAQRGQASEPRLWAGNGPGLLSSPMTVPEPGTLALLAIAGMAGVITRRTNK